MNSAEFVLALLEEAYEKKTWHGPNLSQSMKGVTARQAAWRPARGRHNIWERIEGGKRGSFALKGSNFFTRPEPGNLNEAAWRADKELLKREHRALQQAVARVLSTPRAGKLLRSLYGIAFHDIYHAGQIRLLRRLMEK